MHAKLIALIRSLVVLIRTTDRQLGVRTVATANYANFLEWFVELSLTLVLLDLVLIDNKPQ